MPPSIANIARKTGTALCIGFLCYASPVRALEQEEKTLDTVRDEQLLVELFFNEKKFGTTTCYRYNDDYWVPFSLFLNETGLDEPPPGHQQPRFNTTIGTIKFDTDALRKVEGQECISFTTLKKVFRVHTLQNTAEYAIKFLVPWSPLTDKQENKAQPLSPDIEAPESTLSFLHLEGNTTWHFNDDKRWNYLEFEAGGRIAGGTWDLMTTGDPEKKLSLSRYHWTTWNKNTAFRLGTGSSQITTLLSDLVYTGAQFAWNNRDILRNLDNERYSNTDVLLNLDRTQRRTLEGSGPPGGVAELRFEGSVVARQRITLDGKFVFRNVRMADNLRKTEVYIYEHTAQAKPLRIIDFTRTIASRSLEKGELLFHGGVGQYGNPLIDDNRTNTLTGFSHLLYGLSDAITFDGVLQHNPNKESVDFMLGSVLSIGSRWKAGLYGAYSHGRYGAESSLEGYGKAWTFSSRSLWHETGFGYKHRDEYEHHSLRLQVSPFSFLSTYLYGNYDRTGEDVTSDYLLPGARIAVSSRLSFSALPEDSDGEYVYEAVYRPDHRTTITSRYKDSTVITNIDRDFLHSSLQFINTYVPDNGQIISNVYFDWYPENSFSDRFSIGMSYTDGAFGVTGSVTRYINAGLHLSLTYSNNMINAEGFTIDENLSMFLEKENNHYLYASLTWDLGWSGKKFHPIERSAISHTRGAIAGNLNIEDNARLSSSDINNIGIIVNGRTMRQRQLDGSFFVGNLPPGIYRVSADPENLPVELSLDNRELKVEVESGAVTGFSIPVFASYSVAGMINTPDGKGVPGLSLLVLDQNNNQITTGLTDEFGYYRTDGLRNGEYVISVGGQRRAFTINNDYLFDVNMTLPMKATGAPGSSENGEAAE